MFGFTLFNINTILLYALCGICFFVCAPIILLVFRKHKKTLYIISNVLLILYILILSIGVFGQITIKENNTIILIHFDNTLWLNGTFIFASQSAFNATVNTFLLFPLGQYIALKSKHPILQSIVWSFIVSTIIELLQFVLPIDRTTEILDIILNTISGLLGAIYILLIQKIINEHN